MERKTGVVYVALSASILAVGLVASSYMLSRFFVKIEKDKLLCVKGFSEKIVKSDMGYFTFTITTKSNSLAKCYNQMSASMDIAKRQLKSDGFKDNEISVGNFYSKPVYKKEKGKDTNILLHYTMSQSVEVKSANVDLISKKYINLNSLLAGNIDISVNSPSYFISDLNKYKIELLSKATENARLRAETIAGKSGAGIGKVIWAQQGVIQITAPLSTETSSYGVYDTDSLEKAIKIVVTLKFTVGE